LGADRAYVDLHSALGHLDKLSWDELFARSQVVMLGESNTKSEPGAVATGSMRSLKRSFSPLRPVRPEFCYV